MPLFTNYVDTQAEKYFIGFWFMGYLSILVGFNLIILMMAPLDTIFIRLRSKIPCLKSKQRKPIEIKSKKMSPEVIKEDVSISESMQESE